MRIQRLQRFLPFLMLLALVVMGVPTLSDAQPTCPPDGDVDQNGSVTAADALLAFQQALSLAQLNACQRTIADVFPQPATPDGSITASDALCIFQKALSLPSCLDTLPSSNQPPVVDAGPDQAVDAGVMVFLPGTGNDPDGAIASYAWTQTGGTTVSLTGSDAATAVFVAPEVSVDETLTFRLTVRDDAGAHASDEVRVTVHPVTGTIDQGSAEAVFRQDISGPIVQTKCVTCHVQDGASGNTRLVFVHATDSPDHEALNLRAFEALLAKVAGEGGGSYVLNKIQGVGHGGGVQVSPGTEAFANMQRFLGLLGEEVAPPDLVTVETLFDTVVMASPRKTLRRAALIFAGRIPTDEEYAAVEGGDDSVLRATIRGLMEGPQFHEFLIRASNDRLLTDREYLVIDPDGYYVDFTNEYYRRRVLAHMSGDDRELRRWEDRIQHGVRRAPLELIAYVVENDRPYTEILTADYIMANPWAAAAYGASTYFENPEDVHEFKPSKIVSYYRKGDGFEQEYDPVLGVRVLDPGPLITVYPHAGILNTEVFLQRYPTTATNRNRARARWTYYHFLGVDVEKSASRTTDPVALADTHNPTMHNPACTVCHRILDPVAGAFQNYNDTGVYKANLGGIDSLDIFYKEAQGSTLAIRADSWEARKPLSWKVSLAAGIETLRVVFTNDFYDENTGDDGMIYLDRLTVKGTDGRLLASHEFEDLGPPIAPWGPCGGLRRNPATGRNEQLVMWNGHINCAFFIDIEVPRDGVYEVEIVAWAPPYEQYGDEGFAELSVAAEAYVYHEGDTWYHDMRTPGFAGAAASNPDNSVQWLAQQIVADQRFAEATIKFWWPAIMGGEIAEFPEVAADADFEGLLLAANAQEAEVVRLADGFRRGFQGSPYTYNLKDLLVEIVLSPWFRADLVTDADPVRRIALRDAGARRLLTPEELARKTAAITGVQWGRSVAHSNLNERRPSLLTQEYRLLYGGIDSDGITERTQDITSVMAGVVKRHAAEVSCPIVIREIYFLPNAKRRLFAGVAPARELGADFEIESNSQDKSEVLSLTGALVAGSKIVRLTYSNSARGRIVRLDRLDVRDAAGRVVVSREMEDIEWSGGNCNGPADNHFFMGCAGSLEVPLDNLVAGHYRLELVAWADQAGDEFPRLNLTVLDTEGVAGGADAIRSKLVELYDKLFGVQVTPDSSDVEAAYRFFVDVSERRRDSGGGKFEAWRCNWGHDEFFLEGILDDAIVQYEDAYGQRREFDNDRIIAFLDDVDFSDPHQTAQTWMIVLAAMLMDYRYLYL